MRLKAQLRLVPPALRRYARRILPMPQTTSMYDIDVSAFRHAAAETPRASPPRAFFR